MAAHRLRNFLLMVAMHDYYYCILTGTKYLLKALLTNFRANLEEISGPVINFVALFWSGAVSCSSAIWCTTSQADTLLQDNEFFSISILLYDSLAIFSFYKILKNSRCGAVHILIFLCLPMCKNFLSFSLLDSKKN